MLPRVNFEVISYPLSSVNATVYLGGDSMAL
jgi:hypothetical protein